MGLKLWMKSPGLKCPTYLLTRFKTFQPKTILPRVSWLKSSLLKCLGLNILVLKIGVENFGVEMSCNHITRLSQLDKDGKPVWVPAQTGRALLDEFLIQCSEWADPNDHAVNKFIFKLVKYQLNLPETDFLI